MKTNYFIFAIIIGFVSLIDDGYAIKCYRCNARDDEACNKGLPSLEVHKCPNTVDKCEAYGYQLLKNGKVVSSGFQRGCLSEMGSCRLLYDSLSTIFSSPLLGGYKFQEKSCNVCESDLCNTHK